MQANTRPDNVIDRSAAVPLYHQIFLQLRDEILSGQRAYGVPIGTEKEISQTYSVSRITARRALAELAQPQGDAGHRPHEGGIHRRTVSQVHDELPVAAIHHFLGELLDAGTIEKRTLSFDSNPDAPVGAANQNRGLCIHLLGNYRG